MKYETTITFIGNNEIYRCDKCKCTDISCDTNYCPECGRKINKP